MKMHILTTSELAERIKYDARTIRNQLKDSVLLERHPLHPSIWWPEDSVFMGKD